MEVQVCKSIGQRTAELERPGTTFSANLSSELVVHVVQGNKALQGLRGFLLQRN